MQDAELFFGNKSLTGHRFCFLNFELFFER